MAYLHGKESGFIVYEDEAYVEFGTIVKWVPIPNIELEWNKTFKLFTLRIFKGLISLNL